MRRVLASAILSACCAASGFGQTAAPSPPKATPNAAGADIVVSAERAAARFSIDRKTYDVSRDLQSVSGSVSDILRDLPSVDVDAQGNVSVRGDTNVQILIDGKPSTLVSAANRADYLQQLPADSIERIEVITNPSAQYKPDGSAGLINIVTKKNRKPGRSGSAQASVGTDGRFNLGVTQNYHAGPLSLNGSFNLRQDIPRRPLADRRTQLDPVTGASTASAQDYYFESKRVSEIATVGIDYDLTNADRLSSSVTYNGRSGHPRTTEHNRITDASGAVIGVSDRTGEGREREVNNQESLKYRHSFAGKDHEFTLDLRRDQTIENESRRFTTRFAVPSIPVTIDEQRPRAAETERELTAEYNRPLGAGAKLLIGYDLQRNDDSYDNRASTIDPATNIGTVDPALTNYFVYGQTVHALYGTYERPLGKKLTLLAGLRFEQTVIDTNQATTVQRDHSHYFRAYPTLHLEYELADAQTLRLSYSHRIVRPEPEQLNPYPQFQDPLNLRAGNPQLKPQETDAVEASYQYAAHGLSWEATPYLRLTRNVFTDVSRFISPTVLLTTKENLGRSTAAGLEVAGSGKLEKSLSYSISGNLYYNQIDASNLGVAGTRSTVGYTAKGSADYRLTPKDLAQISVNYTGKRLIAQGYRLPSTSVNLGFRHQIRPGLAAVFTVSDVFNSLRERSLLDTATLHETTSRRRSSRTGNVALSWTIGSKKEAPAAKFDYSE